MYRLAFGLLALCTFVACGHDDKKENKSSPEGLASFFKEAKFPYQISDTGLLKSKDTASIPASLVDELIADSTKENYFGKNSTLKYSPLAKITAKDKENYYIIKASSKNKNAAFLMVFDNQNAFAASTPLLLPDADATTFQSIAIDKALTITKTIVQRDGATVVGEGKEVIAYEAANKSFGIIMMDALNDKPSVLVNPIDTFPKTNKLAGDYVLNKKSLVSVRDGRNPNQLLIFIYTENAAGDCTGQMKGEFVMTTSTTATFRQGGDPCVLTLAFKGNTVTMNEETGCGNYRGLDCRLTGTFTKKKPATPKPASSKPKRR